jgi:hypothetical protein
MKHVYRAIIWTGCAVVAVAAFYVLSYTVLVEVNDVGIVNLGIAYTARVPSYRLGGETAEAIFHPIHDIDLWLRPEVWEGKEGLPPGGGGYF